MSTDFNNLRLLTASDLPRPIHGARVKKVSSRKRITIHDSYRDRAKSSIRHVSNRSGQMDSRDTNKVLSGLNR